jgi:hypothetical protein
MDVCINHHALIGSMILFEGGYLIFQLRYVILKLFIFSL